METNSSQQLSSHLETHVGYCLRQVSNQVSGAFARALHERRTSVAEWVILCYVHENPETTPGELAAALALTRGAVSKIIDKLETKDWLTSSTNPDDNRVQLLSSTRKGSRILPELAAIADRNDRAFFDVLETEEKTALQRILSKLVAIHRIGRVPIE